MQPEVHLSWAVSTRQISPVHLCQAQSSPPAKEGIVSIATGTAECVFSFDFFLVLPLFAMMNVDRMSFRPP